MIIVIDKFAFFVRYYLFRTEIIFVFVYSMLIVSDVIIIGAASGSIDLLPNPSDVKTEDGAENDQIFYFDGKKNAIEISPTKFESRVKEHFTISTWMKHNENPESPEQKEHLLCNSDGESKYCHLYKDKLF